MEITYTKHGDYYLPDLALPEEEPATYGRFGRMRSNSKISAVPKGSGHSVKGPTVAGPSSCLLSK